MFSYGSRRALILVAFVYAASVFAFDEDVSDDEIRCGDQLTKVLNDLCNGRFQDMYKRAGANTHPNVDFDTKLGSYGMRGDMFSSGSGSGRVIRKRRSAENRFRYVYGQGIIQQCCENSCSVNSMLRYCKQ